jgi:hypothetical protein
MPLLDPRLRQVQVGRATVRKQYSIEQLGTVTVLFLRIHDASNSI